MKWKCSMIALLLKMLLLFLVITVVVYRENVLSALSMINLGATLDGYSTLWCNINNNSVLDCEVHMQTHMPRTSQCNVHLGSGIYDFCGA